MATQNQGKVLWDYSTWGTGAGFGVFLRPSMESLGLGFVVFFVFRHFEINVTAIDPLTKETKP